MSDSFYRFFPGDYLRDTGDLSLIEHGAYRLLLDHYYTQEYLPSDRLKLYRICRAFDADEKSAIDAVVVRIFKQDGTGRLLPRKAEEEIAGRRKYLEDQARKSRLGVQARGLTPKEPMDVPKENPRVDPRVDPKVDPPSPSPSPLPLPSPSPPPKKEKRLFVEGEEPLRLCHVLFDAMKCNNPNCKEPNWQVWAFSIDAMIRIDKRNPTDIEALIQWCQDDSFLKCTILSTKKLRDKSDQLMVKMNGSGRGIVSDKTVRSLKNIQRWMDREEEEDEEQEKIR